MAAGDLDAPSIPILINNSIDPDSLAGGPLSTYAKYANPVLGDKLFQNWLGKTEQGDAVDITDVQIDVDPDQETEDGFPMLVANHLIHSLDKGQVFYSYFLERVTGEAKEESKRIHFGVGKQGLLSAPQIKESHDLQLDLSAFTGDLTIALTPFGAMSIGDDVKVIWKGEKSNGDSGDAVSLPVKTLEDTDLGKVLSWNVPKAKFVPLRSGKLTLSYEITYSATLATTLSAERKILITAPVDAALPVASVKDLTGTEINPGQFRQGIRVVIPVYPGIRVGDEIIVYGRRTEMSPGSDKNTIQYLKIDSSIIESGKVEVPIGYQWLMDNRGADITLDYQYARPDASGSGETLKLSIVEPLVLPPPTVDRSVEVAGQDELNPVLAVSGAYITIPVNSAIGDKEVTVFWKGFGAIGSYETNEPSQSDPMKFKVPPEYIPPNIGKTVEVTYQVAGQDADTPLKLYVRPLAAHPGIECDKVQIGDPATLKLSDIPDAGAVLTVALWPFISTQQQVRLWLSSSATGERDIIPVRNVLEDEVSGRVKARLFKTDLAGIAANSQVVFKAAVSFDAGNQMFTFNKPLLIKLVD